MADLQNLLVISVVIFAIFSFILVIEHEMKSKQHELDHSLSSHLGVLRNQKLHSLSAHHFTRSSIDNLFVLIEGEKVSDPSSITEIPIENELTYQKREEDPIDKINEINEIMRSEASQSRKESISVNTDELRNKESKSGHMKLLNESPIPTMSVSPRHRIKTETKGKLICNNKEIESEIIYWKIVEGDDIYESPITPHHGLHHDRYITFEYDQGGWNNVRMSLECNLVIAHATGRTLVIPPQQHLYLLTEKHKDEGVDKKEHNEMGFEDFFSLNLLSNQKGFHMMEMDDFLLKEAVTGGLHGELPPNNSTQINGNVLWKYLDKVADITPEWTGKFLAFPAHISSDFNLTRTPLMNRANERMKEFGGERVPVFYDEKLQEVHHIHFPADHNHRLLQHHYAFTFFADPEMQSFYKRFIRDYMRYKDNIQCAGHELVQAVREDARNEIINNPDGKYYALHIRRGDFQYKDVKLSAADIVKNLHDANGIPIIPPGSLVYVSTDDPEGICVHCYAQRQPCESFAKGSKPIGCPEDSSWSAFTLFGWKIKFLHNYTKDKGMFKGMNPNLFGMMESIVCSRAEAFAGTFHSTFTGFIHRLRGYHGLGESTYYHSNHLLNSMRLKKSVGHGFSREWRAGWTDDQGNLI